MRAAQVPQLGRQRVQENGAIHGTRTNDSVEPLDFHPGQIEWGPQHIDHRQFLGRGVGRLQGPLASILQSASVFPPIAARPCSVDDRKDLVPVTFRVAETF